MPQTRKSRRRKHEGKEAVSELTTERLSVYLRCLTYLESIDEKTISSQELARRFHLNSAQIRKDLACFGEFGIRGVGYDVTLLKEHLIKSLGIDRPRKVVIAGAGNLGLALADYAGFNVEGFQIVSLIETDPSKIGTSTRNSIPIRSLDELPSLVRRHGIEIGILAVPAEAAQAVFDAMVSAGITAILNFAPVRIQARRRVKLKSVDLRINLESLSFHLRNAEEGIVDDDALD